jgi:hypothetical protein
VRGFTHTLGLLCEQFGLLHILLGIGIDVCLFDIGCFVVESSSLLCCVIEMKEGK